MQYRSFRRQPQRGERIEPGVCRRYCHFLAFTQRSSHRADFRPECAICETTVASRAKRPDMCRFPSWWIKFHRRSHFRAPFDYSRCGCQNLREHFLYFHQKRNTSPELEVFCHGYGRGAFEQKQGTAEKRALFRRPLFLFESPSAVPVAENFKLRGSISFLMEIKEMLPQILTAASGIIKGSPEMRPPMKLYPPRRKTAHIRSLRPRCNRRFTYGTFGAKIGTMRRTLRERKEVAIPATHARLDSFPTLRLPPE